MAEITKIQWTDATFNPWVGCQKVSAGCANCYAEVSTPTRKSRSEGLELWGPDGKRRLTSEANWSLPHRWNRAAEKAAKPTRVFCASLADVFEDNNSQMVNDKGQSLYLASDTVITLEPTDRPYTLNHARARLFRIIEETPWLQWQVLTKRPENMELLAPPHWLPAWPTNVWAGCTVEDQPRAEERIGKLLAVNASVRFLSLEPLLGPITLDISRWGSCYHEGYDGRDHEADHRECACHLDWVIVGGESGHNARPCHLEWVRSLVQQCQTAGVACFVKQLGSKPTAPPVAPSGHPYPLQLRDPKGGDPSKWPVDLRIREFPQEVTCG